MPDYRRWFRAGGMYFFTIVAFNRRKIFCNVHQGEHSSFHRWVKEGVYRRDWLCQCLANSEAPDFEVIAYTAGE